MMKPRMKTSISPHLMAQQCLPSTHPHASVRGSAALRMKLETDASPPSQGRLAGLVAKATAKSSVAGNMHLRRIVDTEIFGC
jgi:hypothetical protein